MSETVGRGIFRKVALAAAIVAILGVSFGLTLRPTMFANRSSGIQLPAELIQHFQQLNDVEFCSMWPSNFQFVGDPAEFETGPAADLGHGFIDGYPIADVRTVDCSIVDHVVNADANDNGMVAACFVPRHAIRDPGDPEIWILLCFQCSSLQFNYGQESGGGAIGDTERAYFENLVSKLTMSNGAGSKENE